MGAQIPHYDADFYSDEFIRNPHPHYAAMRSLGPVVFLSQLGNYALTRHRTAQAALRDPARFFNRNGVAGDAFGCEFLQGNTLASDGARHSALRRALAPPLLPGALEAIRPKIAEVSEDLIDSLVTQGTFDTPRDLSSHLPFTIVRDLVGLPDHGQDNMQKWAAAAFDVLGCQNERGQAAVEVIKEMRGFIQGDITRESVKKGSWAARILDLVDAGQLSPDLAPFAVRDYTNPSLDSTISATSQLIWLLSEHPDEWQKIRENPDFAVNAVNEAIRLGTPARSFTRQVADDTDVEGFTIPAGSRVQLLYASANRDEEVFPEPDRFDITRDPKLHLGFGGGVHMCAGMHLAQLEMIALLHAMSPRVSAIECGTPEVALNNTIYSFEKLPTRFIAASGARGIKPVVIAAKQALTFPMRVVHRSDTATDIVVLDLESATGAPLPAVSAGAHIDLFLRDGLVRQYSLTGDLLSQKDRYRIAVQRDANSRGGSQAVFDLLKPGQDLLCGGPRNAFPLQDCAGHIHLFSGGIGMTPIYAMAWDLHHKGHAFTWHLSARSRDRAALLAEVRATPFADRVRLRFDDQPSDLPGLADDITRLGPQDHLYLCGPTGYMEFVRNTGLTSGLTEAQIHLEHFGAEIDSTGDPFDVVLARSNRTISVSPDETILKALEREGIAVPSACQNGVCGSCLTPVIKGQPDHRDLVLTDAEKAKGDRIAVCCSRSTSKELVLDL